MSKAGAVVLCAGSSTRFGSDKLLFELAGRPVWRASVEAFVQHPEVDEVVIVASEGLIGQIPPGPYTVVAGGSTRQESALAGLHALSEQVEFVLFHDGARPFVSPSLIHRVIEACRSHGAAVPCLPITDSVKRSQAGKLESIDRDGLYTVQTPQAGRKADFLRAYAQTSAAVTDDVSILEQIGIFAFQVPGEHDNMKLTTEDDGYRALGLNQSIETRTGLGFDVHAFSSDPNRPLWLGGVAFPGERGLEGHSDADPLLHALTDAILGACVLGDIGQLFPNNDPQWKNAPSKIFLQEAVRQCRAANWTLEHLDATVLAEAPKLSSRSMEIRQTVAELCGLGVEEVSLKATTMEQLGAIGRREGIAAMATATVSRPRPRR